MSFGGTTAPIPLPNGVGTTLFVLEPQPFFRELRGVRCSIEIDGTNVERILRLQLIQSRNTAAEAVAFEVAMKDPLNTQRITGATTTLVVAAFAQRVNEISVIGTTLTIQTASIPAGLCIEPNVTTVLQLLDGTATDLIEEVVFLVGPGERTLKDALAS